MQKTKSEMSLFHDELPQQHISWLSQNVEELSLWHAVTQQAHRHHQQQQQQLEDGNMVIVDTMEALEQLFTQSKASRSFVRSLAEQEYVAWQHYYQSLYRKQLQTTLLLPDYLPTCQASPQLTHVCCVLQRLQASETRMARYFSMDTNKTCMVVRELMRPWVQRLVYHFVKHDPNRPTTFRTDRLTEWLFSYIQTHVFDAGVWEFVQSILLSPTSSSMLFVQEFVQLVQYVLTERNVFRNQDNPVILMKHIEQLFLFDSNIQQWGGSSLRRLVDVFVVGDEELWDWWLQNEQQMALKSCWEDEEEDESMTSCAEFVCARFRSMQRKASLISLRSMYVSTVVAPFCTRLLDLWQEKAMRLRPTDYSAWSEWIQGMHMMVDFLQQHHHHQQPEMDDDEVTNDLLQFAASLQGLENAVVEDLFAKTMVERVLLHEAKLASYFMRCSFQVASNETTEDDAVELIEVRQVMTRFYQETITHGNAGPLPAYAFQRMRESVLSLLAEPFLQVALNADGMTLELAESGSRVFANQVQSVFGIFSTTELPLTAQRFLDATRWMSMEHTELSGLGNALCGLAGIPAPLTIDPFVQDNRLAEEAMAMLQAKGFVSIELADAISILNRRVDMLGA